MYRLRLRMKKNNFAKKWVGSLPGTPTVAYDDDVIFLGTGTFSAFRLPPWSIDHTFLKLSAVGDFENHASKRNKNENKKLRSPWLPNSGKNYPTACIQLHSLRSRRSLRSSAQFLLRPGDTRLTRTQFGSSIHVQANHFWGPHIWLHENTRFFAEHLRPIPG